MLSATGMLYRGHSVRRHADWVTLLYRKQCTARMHCLWTTKADRLLALQPQENHAR